MEPSFEELKLFCGNASRQLAQKVGGTLGKPLAQYDLREFADGEIFIEILESVRGKDVFVIQSTSAPVNTNYVHLFLLLDALKRASAKKITAIVPYFGYSRQDRLVGRSPISASLFAHFMQEAGAASFVSVDLHSPAIQGFFDIPVDNLTATRLFAEHYAKKNLGEVTVVSPDVGGLKRCRGLARRLDATLAVVDKQRPKPNVSEASRVVGDVEGRTCILFDDIVDTGGSVAGAAAALEQNGAKKIFAAATHAVLSNNAGEKISDSPIEELVVSDSIELVRQSPKIVQVSLAPMIAEAIRRIHERKSMSEMLDKHMG